MESYEVLFQAMGWSFLDLDLQVCLSDRSTRGNRRWFMIPKAAQIDFLPIRTILAHDLPV